MKLLITLLLSASVVLAQKPPTPVASAFVSSLSKVKAQARVAVLLPSELPQPIAEAKHANVDKASQKGYTLSLFYDSDGGNASFAASFSAEAHPCYRPDELPNVRKVQLAQDTVGYFRPVSCGGSCAPANLWWEKGQVLYQIQLKLSSTLAVQEQRRIIIATANSAILAGPR